jgi:hypothetical protein
MPNDKPLGEINLECWEQYDDLITDSLWLLGKRDSSGAHTADYWGNFAPQIPYQAMRRFTKPGELVIDPFVGFGTTLIEAVRLGRCAIGVDLQPHCVDTAQARVGQEACARDARALAIVGDSTRPETAAAVQAVMRQWDFPHAHLLILHPRITISSASATIQATSPTRPASRRFWRVSGRWSATSRRCWRRVASSCW